MIEIRNTKSDIVVYQDDDGKISFNVNVFEETVWLTQKHMAELFDKNQRTISEHINNIFRECELGKNSVHRNFRYTASDGKEYDIKHYNLDVIISVGYRVKSQRGTQFRIWATRILKQYMLNGYAINETRIKHIESVMDELVSSHKIMREDVDRIENLLIKLIEKPIIIHNHNKISLENKELEDKIILLIDKLIDDLKDSKDAKTQLEKVKSDISELPQNLKAKNRVISFFKEIGDSKSDFHKTIKGAGIAKNIISELVNIGVKLKDLL